jgi:hypothetical protein
VPVDRHLQVCAGAGRSIAVAISLRGGFAVVDLVAASFCLGGDRVDDPDNPAEHLSGDEVLARSVTEAGGDRVRTRKPGRNRDRRRIDRRARNRILQTDLALALDEPGRDPRSRWKLAKALRTSHQLLIVGLVLLTPGRNPQDATSPDQISHQLLGRRQLTRSPPNRPIALQPARLRWRPLRHRALLQPLFPSRRDLCLPAGATTSDRDQTTVTQRRRRDLVRVPLHHRHRATVGDPAQHTNLISGQALHPSRRMLQGDPRVQQRHAPLRNCTNRYTMRGMFVANGTSSVRDIREPKQGGGAQD